MSDRPLIADQYILWVLVMKDGKWIPDSKFDGGRMTSALKRAEDLDRSPDYQAVKAVRIATDGSGEQKEIWASSRLKARAEAQRANQLSKAVVESAAKFAPKKSSPAHR